MSTYELLVTSWLTLCSLVYQTDHRLSTRKTSNSSSGWIGNPSCVFWSPPPALLGQEDQQLYSEWFPHSTLREQQRWSEPPDGVWAHFRVTLYLPNPRARTFRVAVFQRPRPQSRGFNPHPDLFLFSTQQRKCNSSIWTGGLPQVDSRDATATSFTSRTA